MGSGEFSLVKIDGMARKLNTEGSAPRNTKLLSLGSISYLKILSSSGIDDDAITSALSDPA